VGKLKLENAVLKKAFQNSLSRSQGNGKSSGFGDVSVLPSSGGCKVMKLARSSFYHKPKDKKREGAEGWGFREQD